VPGRWHVMGVMLAAGGSLQWFRNRFCGDEIAVAQSLGRDPYELMSDAAATAPVGSEGLLFLPYLSGERTPYPDPNARGAFVGLTAATLPINVLLRLVNIGTLLAFVIVCAAVWIMRRTHPEAERPFRAPLIPLVPILGMAACLLLMFSLPAVNWLRLAVWLLAGLVIYVGYGRHHSVMAQESKAARSTVSTELAH
jgi:amino acid transporter